MSRALVIGAGGLGCPVVVGLAEGGVSGLTLVDPDVVELSNLQRQVLYTTADVGRPKVEVAAERLAPMGVEVRTRRARFGADNAAELIAGHDVIVDATDDPAARFVLNDAALEAGVPTVFGGILGFHGLVLAVAGQHGPCYRCLFEAPPAPEDAATCGQAGVLGALAGLVGHLQVRRALGLLAGEVARHTGLVTTIDALTGRIRDVALPEASDCPACGGLQARLDITGEICPMTLVRTKLALEALTPGQLLEVRMRRGEPSRNVPRSLSEEGHEVLSAGAVDTDHFRVVVRRAAS